MNLLNICVNLSLSSCDEPLALPSGCAKGLLLLRVQLLLPFILLDKSMLFSLFFLSDYLL
jgi:hypothetical protein